MAKVANSAKSVQERELLVRVLAAVTFLIFFQAYMVAPMLPHLARQFGVSPQLMGLIVPAYLIPYGISTLFYGLLSDRIGRRRIMLASLLAFTVLTALTATAQTPSELLVWRLLTGIGASGVVPLALALVGTLFPYEERGRPLGWLFGAMAGGMAFGSSFGVLLEPLITWRGLFVAVGGFGMIALILLRHHAGLLGESASTTSVRVEDVLHGYKALLTDRGGRITYIYVFLNSTFHSGVFTWLGLYFNKRYGLGEVGIGLALLGYGVPGFLFGPVIGRAADRWGRRWLVSTGMYLAALAAALLANRPSIVVAAALVTALSLGYDMTQPLLAGIVTSLNRTRAGQAMGLNVFMLFSGFGLGSIIFGELLRKGLMTALLAFAVPQLLLASEAIFAFRFERRTTDVA